MKFQSSSMVIAGLFGAGIVLGGFGIKFASAGLDGIDWH